MKHAKKGKQVKSSFKIKNVVSSLKPLELLHMDLFGPSRTMSLGGNYYAFVIVDDYSRYTWTLFLESKSDAFSAFKKLARRLQNTKNNNIGSIRSDHGGEFQNEKFSKFCEKLGILHNFSAPRTPQQNGVVERKNRFLEQVSPHVAPSQTSAGTQLLSLKLNQSQLRKLSRMRSGLKLCMKSRISLQGMRYGFLSLKLMKSILLVRNGFSGTS